MLTKTMLQVLATLNFEPQKAFLMGSGVLWWGELAWGGRGMWGKRLARSSQMLTMATWWAARAERRAGKETREIVSNVLTAATWWAARELNGMQRGRLARSS